MNFEPGQQHVYSNSNYILLAEIVKQTSGQPLNAFAQTTIFKPLQMNHTLFIERVTELPGDRAVSYYKEGSTYPLAPHLIFTVGDGGMFSTIEDLAKWLPNFYNPKVGDKQDIGQLTQNGLLTNGEKISYASGIVVDGYKDFRQFTHGGGLYGYRTNLAVFPDLKLGIVILSNNGQVNPTLKTNQVADILLKQYPSLVVTPQTARSSVNDTMVVDPAIAKAISGRYISEDGLLFTFSLTGHNLYWHSKELGRTHLVQTAKGTFEEPSTQVRFVFSTTG